MTNKKEPKSLTEKIMNGLGIASLFLVIPMGIAEYRLVSKTEIEQEQGVVSKKIYQKGSYRSISGPGGKTVGYGGKSEKFEITFEGRNTYLTSKDKRLYGEFKLNQPVTIFYRHYTNDVLGNKKDEYRVLKITPLKDSKLELEASK